MALLASLRLAACSEPAQIVEFDESRFKDWSRDELQEYFERTWTISIIERPGPPWSEDSEFFVPDSKGVLKEIVDECLLGFTVLNHGDHGYAFLSIEESPLPREKIACIRRFERRGVTLIEPAWSGVLAK